jgi:hypothetical protein
MRELTERKQGGKLVDALLADDALFHLEADLRWIDLTAARLAALAEEVRAVQHIPSSCFNCQSGTGSGAVLK